MDKVIKSNSLEQERALFIATCSDFIDNTVKRVHSFEGRPTTDYPDILKCLLIQSWNGLSYRRVASDLLIVKTFGLIFDIPKKSTLCKYMSNPALTAELEHLIQESAFPFLNTDHTLIVDSTWFALKMYSGGHNRKPTAEGDKKANIPPLEKCKKLHIGCLATSKIIAFAKASPGTANDSPFFKDIISTVCTNGFMISKCLADAGYMSKDNYALCQELNVKQVFIDFRSNVTGKHPKSKAFRDAFNLYTNQPDVWHEDYRYRVLIESVFSVIKRKFLNWLRTKSETAQYNEMLLKVLCYNLTILVRFR